MANDNRAANMAAKPWTAKELAILNDLRLTDDQVRAKLKGRSADSIRRKRERIVASRDGAAAAAKARKSGDRLTLLERLTKAR